MGFLNNDNEFTDESLSLLMRDLKGFITAVDSSTLDNNRKPNKIKTSAPVIHTSDRDSKNKEYIVSDFCKGCSKYDSNPQMPTLPCSGPKTDICWYKASKHAKELLASLNKLV